MRQETSTTEGVEVQATSELGSDMFQALTSEDGPLAAGNLPGIKCATEQGVMNLYSMLDDEGKKPATLGVQNLSSTCSTCAGK